MFVDLLQGYAVWLADGLGLRSVACVDGFVNVDSGEMIVMDVKPNPPLTDGSPIFQQVSRTCAAVTLPACGTE